MDDFIGSGGYNNNRKSEDVNAKKWMKIIGVVLVLLFILVIAIICLMYYIDTTEIKISVDGKPTSALKNIFIFENDEIYIPIRKFAQFVGYESYSGDYKEEYIAQTFVKNTNEEAYFNLNSNTIYKKLLDGNDDYEYYEIDEPVKMIDNQLCTTIEGAQIAFNISMSYKKNNITIYTLPYLVNYYTAKNKNSAISDKDVSFSNQKALLHNMIIVKNANNYYGVSLLNGQEILGTKYKSIKFIESTREFIVKTVEDKMGIMSYDQNTYQAITKISPEYDNIKQIDKNNGLYLVTNNKKQGVVNQNGSVIVYLEYDQVGIDKLKYNDIKNTYLLYDKCIPVKLNNKWGLIDKTGKKIFEVKYDDLGCTINAGTVSENNANSVLLIPKYEGIVVKEGESYGLVNSNGKRYLPSVLTAVYSTTTEGETTYKMIYTGQTMNVISYLEKYVIKNDNNATNNQSSTTNGEASNTNTQTNSTTNTTTDNQTNNSVETSSNVVENSQNTQTQTNSQEQNSQETNQNNQTTTQNTESQNNAV